MPTMFDVDTNKLILKIAEELKKMPEIQPPVWAEFVKTGMHKERPPKQDDWWYLRAAAVLRAVRLLGPVGVNKLRRKYGGIKNRGHQREKFFKGSGNIIRKVLQQLEKAGLVAKSDKSVKKGKIITPKGISLLDKLAVQLHKEKPVQKKEVKVEHPQQEKKPQSAPQKKEAPKAAPVAAPEKDDDEEAEEEEESDDDDEALDKELDTLEKEVDEDEHRVKELDEKEEELEREIDELDEELGESDSDDKEESDDDQEK